MFPGQLLGAGAWFAFAFAFAAVAAPASGRAASGRPSCNVSDADYPPETSCQCESRWIIFEDLRRTYLDPPFFGHAECVKAAELLVGACDSLDVDYLQGLHEVAKVAAISKVPQERFNVVYKVVVGFLRPQGAKEIQRPLLWRTFMQLANDAIPHGQLTGMRDFLAAIPGGDGRTGLSELVVGEWLTLFKNVLPLALREKAFEVVERDGDFGMVALTLTILKKRSAVFNEILDLIETDPEEAPNFKKKTIAKFHELSETGPSIDFRGYYYDLKLVKDLREKEIDIHSNPFRRSWM